MNPLSISLVETFFSTLNVILATGLFSCEGIATLNNDQSGMLASELGIFEHTKSFLILLYVSVLQPKKNSRSGNSFNETRVEQMVHQKRFNSAFHNLVRYEYA